MLLTLAVVRYRLRRSTDPSGLRDDHIRRIVESGVATYELDEPLDEDEIEQAEREFWDEERWDEAEEW